ncbi:MAG TPA: hypothetical protein ACQGQH_09355 [Xylella sp.]
MLTQGVLLENQRYLAHPPCDGYLLTVAGQDFFPVLFLMGVWGRHHSGGGTLVRFPDAQTGTEIKPIAVDEVTGAKTVTTLIWIVIPEQGRTGT